MQWNPLPKCMHKIYSLTCMSTVRKNCKGTNNSQNFCDSRSNNTFPTRTLQFKALQQINPSDDISFSINTLKYFLRKIGERKKKTDHPLKDLNSSEATMHEIMETITSNESDISIKNQHKNQIVSKIYYIYSNNTPTPPHQHQSD